MFGNKGGQYHSCNLSITLIRIRPGICQRGKGKEWHGIRRNGNITIWKKEKDKEVGIKLSLRF